MGCTDFETSILIASGLWLDRHIFNESEMALFFECMPLCAQKVLDTADIVREAIYRHLSDFDTMSEGNLDANGRPFYCRARKLCCPSSLQLLLGAQSSWD